MSRTIDGRDDIRIGDICIATFLSPGIKKKSEETVERNEAMSLKVFISTSSFGVCDQKPLELLKQHDVEVILNPFGRKLTRGESISLFHDIDGLIAGTETIDGEVLDHSRKLKVISRCGAGMDNVDLEKAASLGIRVYSTPDGPTGAVAEMTVALMLNALRRVSQQDAEMKKGVWKKRTGNLLSGKTIGILGLGRIGKRVVELIEAFGVKVVCWELSPDVGFVKRHDIAVESLDEVLRKSDLLTVHLPGIPSLRHLIGERELNMMKNEAILINTARGELVDEAALYNALNSLNIRAAAIDVFEQEPYEGPLSQLDNITLTPHVASAAEESRIEMEMEAVENLLKGFFE